MYDKYDVVENPGLMGGTKIGVGYQIQNIGKIDMISETVQIAYEVSQVFKISSANVKA